MLLSALMEVSRNHLLERIRASLSAVPVTVLTGPRQSGKTTLARELLSEGSPAYFDLEDPISLARLQEPMTALGDLKGLVVIDEVQRRPDLFPVLRVLVDRSENSARFLILGSASGDLLRQSSESLAGRIRRIEVSGFDLTELGTDIAPRLWLRGGLPRSYLADTDATSLEWRRDFIRTLLERDFPQWGVQVAASALQRFWSTLAHRHAQLWNASDLARVLGVDPTTTRRYLDLLTDALVVRQLQPWHANLGKRQVKSPKVYVRDSGLLHQLLGIPDTRTLLEHAKVGPSWEGFVIEQVLATQPHDEAWFWAVHQGPEMDLVLRVGDELYGVEVKRADAPTLTPALRTAMTALRLRRTAVIYPGDRHYPLGDQVSVVPLARLAERGGLFAFPGYGYSATTAHKTINMEE